MPRDLWEEGLRPLEIDEGICEDCDGVGTFLVRIGEKRCWGQGGVYEPEEVERECDSCRGEGVVQCHEHGWEVVACWLTEPSETLCESCLEDLGTDLQGVKVEVIQRQCADPLLQWGTSFKEALLEGMGEMAAREWANLQLKVWMLHQKGRTV